VFYFFIFGLIFKDFFKVQVNINLGSNIFYFSIWAFFFFFIAIGIKKILKIQKTNECKKCYSINKSLKMPKKQQKKKVNFKNAIRGRLPISLTANC
jgi:hypothetical protein